MNDLPLPEAWRSEAFAEDLDDIPQTQTPAPLPLPLQCPADTFSPACRR